MPWNLHKISFGIIRLGTALFLTIIVNILGCTPNKETKRQNVIIKASASWVGNWIRKQFQNPGKLEIIKVSQDSIQFELHASSGGHEGSIDGIAVVKDTTVAIFSTKEGSDSCRLELSFVGDSVITVKESGNNCFAAIGVTYNGEYRKEKALLGEDENEETLLDLEIFKTKEQDSIFRSLVGDKYPLFVNSTQLTSEDDDLDSMHTVVKSSGVRGLFTLMENVIMIDSVNNIWAAVIDDKQKVLYFTNSKVYKNKLPKTIDNWRRNFMEYPVIYNQ